ncbi:hypothetical protein A2U01_0104826, partial [Trifolium medium]|nr:hypothetical protein [Trifolium medium]
MRWLKCTALHQISILCLALTLASAGSSLDSFGSGRVMLIP